MGASKMIFICPKCASAFRVDNISKVLICPFCGVLIIIDIEDVPEKETEKEKEKKKKVKKTKAKKTKAKKDVT